MSKELFPSEIVAIKTEETEETDRRQSDNTPNAKKSSLCGPRTPTPFKNALNEIRKIHGQSYVPSSPNGLVEDITEIMEKEQQQDSTMDSVYETDHSTGIVQAIDKDAAPTTSNPKRLVYDESDMNQHQKKAKKSLESTWSTTASESTDFPYLVETPVNILINLLMRSKNYKSIFTFVFYEQLEQSAELEFGSGVFPTEYCKRYFG